jgi:cysteine-rich repeat protein
MSFLRDFGVVGMFVAASALVAAACSDENTTATTSTTGTPNGGGGSAGATTSTTGGGMPGGGGVGGMPVGGGGTGGVPIPDTGTDECPGDPYVLSAPGTSFYLAGDSTMATNNVTSSFCATPTEAPELVYAFTINAPGSLKMQVREATPGDPWNPTMFLRFGGCEDPAFDYGCFEFFEGHEEFAVHFGQDFPFFTDTFPAVLYVFIDGDAANIGSEYTLKVEYNEPTCGDGITNAFDTAVPEECDDGNNTPNDGCSPTCTFETITVFDACEGEPVILLPNQPQALQGSTTPYDDDYTAAPGGGCLAPQPGGKDRLYKIVPSVDGSVTASVGYATDGVTDVCEKDGFIDPSCWDRTLWVVGPNTCANGPQIACSEVGLTAPEQITFPVSGGSNYFIVVDGYSNNPFPLTYGPYVLNIELTP